MSGLPIIQPTSITRAKHARQQQALHRGSSCTLLRITVRILTTIQQEGFSSSAKETSTHIPCKILEELDLEVSSGQSERMMEQAGPNCTSLDDLLKKSHNFLGRASQELRGLETYYVLNLTDGASDGREYFTLNSCGVQGTAGEDEMRASLSFQPVPLKSPAPVRH